MLTFFFKTYFWGIFVLLLISKTAQPKRTMGAPVYELARTAVTLFHSRVNRDGS